MRDLSLIDLGLKLRAAKRDVEIFDVAKAFFASRGVCRIGYHHNQPIARMAQETKGPTVFAEGFPEDWVCHYIRERLVRVDPIPEVAMRTGRMFRWADVESMGPLSEAQRGFLDVVRDAVMGDGLAIPLFGPQMRNGYLGLGFGRDGVTLSEREELELRMAAQLAHERYCELQVDFAVEYGALTTREREILEWMARGKSNALIAQILRISPHTVDTLVRRIFVKLDASDRTTAVMKGLSLGALQMGEGRVA